MKRLTRTSIMIIAIVFSFISLASAESLNDKYTAALNLLQSGDYSAASDAFSNLGNYEDSSKYSMYCQAISMGELGMFSLAISNLNTLGNFRDSELQAKYYTALSVEQLEHYEEATVLLDGMEFFRDTLERISTYPEKINARDYVEADTDGADKATGGCHSPPSLPGLPVVIPVCRQHRNNAHQR